jgi:hypothetical protein
VESQEYPRFRWAFGCRGNEKKKHCDVAGVAGAFLMSLDPDSDDAPDMVGFRESRGRGRTLSCARVWEFKLVGRATRVLMSTQARAMAMGGAAS